MAIVILLLTGTFTHIHAVSILAQVLKFTCVTGLEGQLTAPVSAPWMGKWRERTKRGGKHSSTRNLFAQVDRDVARDERLERLRRAQGSQASGSEVAANKPAGEVGTVGAEQSNQQDPKEVKSKPEVLKPKKLLPQPKVLPKPKRELPKPLKDRTSSQVVGEQKSK